MIPSPENNRHPVRNVSDRVCFFTRAPKFESWTQEIGIWRAAGERKISPGRGVRTLAGGKSASALAAPGKLKKYRSPGGVTASHGVGRKPGDGKAQHQCSASLSVTPPGLHFNLSHSGGCARFAGLPPASVLSPTSWAQISSGFQPDKFQFLESRIQTLGHV